MRMGKIRSDKSRCALLNEAEVQAILRDEFVPGNVRGVIGFCKISNGPDSFHITLKGAGIKSVHA